MKKLLSIVFAVIIFVMSMEPMYAMEKRENDDTDFDIEYWIEEDYIVDRQGNKYTQFYNASGEQVPIEDALSIFNGKPNDEEMLPNSRALVPNYTTVEVLSLNQNYLGSPVKMTQDAQGPCQLSYSLSSSVEYSFTGSMSLSIQELILKTIELEFGLDLTMAKINTDTVQVNYSVPAGKVGAIYFRPYYIKAVGRCVESSGVANAYTACYPKKLNNGYADGLFYLQER